MTGRRIAVIGGGVSGITAGYVLSRFKASAADGQIMDRGV
jgi:predicted NAD/FAD-binding protein